MYYIVQVLAKSVKPIPVLLLGVLLGGRSYPLIKYLCVLLIVFGVGIFLYKERTPNSSQDSQETFKLYDIIGFGEILLVSQPAQVHDGNNCKPLVNYNFSILNM